MQQELEPDGDRPPLAWSQHGDPIEVPPEAVGWRVRRHRIGDRGGPPEVVYMRGRPLILSLAATAEDLLAQVGARPGHYRLEAVDAQGRPLKSSPAFAVIEAGQAAAAVNTPEVSGSCPNADLSARLLASLEQVTRTQAEVMTAMINQMSHTITAAGGLLVPASKHRNGVVEIIQPAPSADSAPPPDWMAFLMGALPALQPLIEALSARVKASATADEAANASMDGAQ